MFNSADSESLIVIAVAALLGAVLGIEREIAKKPAGVRTHILVCAGSALMMVLGQAIVDQFQAREPAEVIKADPIRVLQAIVVGISFLGAGTIIHDRDEVEGLTTAATVYLTAGIGVAVAVGRIPLAVLITIAAVVVLSLVGWLESLFESLQEKQDRRSDQSPKTPSEDSDPPAADRM
ncbi:MgtC/SapB family protein [Stieleria sp. TO1_6]|uniref:MgtC/SapB family protein n=1 Tax=Stieleria tagensis TaxID=2956795 RepID=UPI00209B9310|nr:MgtC/SapB family protein [Stieleria tagensis]MCO8121677.1 MgtC/SapB family protein [Stieleria tagensis]